jgi:hypothetical protein
VYHVCIYYQTWPRRARTNVVHVFHISNSSIVIIRACPPIPYLKLFVIIRACSELNNRGWLQALALHLSNRRKMVEILEPPK